MKTRKILSYCFLFREKLCINYCHILENPTCFYNFKNSCFCVKTNVLTMTLYCVLNCNQNTLHVKVHGPVRNIIMIITHGLQCQCAMAICRWLTTSKINGNFNKHSIVTDGKKKWSVRCGFDLIYEKSMLYNEHIQWFSFIFNKFQLVQWLKPLLTRVSTSITLSVSCSFHVALTNPCWVP